MLLELMVVSAESAEVAAAGGAVLVVRLGVVSVAPPGGLAAGRETAGQVPYRDEFSQPEWYLVGGAGQEVSAAVGGGVGRSLFGCSLSGLTGSGSDRGEQVSHALVRLRARGLLRTQAAACCGAEFAGGDDHGYPCYETAMATGTGAVRIGY